MIDINDVEFVKEVLCTLFLAGLTFIVWGFIVIVLSVIFSSKKETK